MKQAIRPAIFKWRQTEPELIVCAVRWYLRYSLSFRDVKERRCCMNTRCGWGGVARTSRDPVWGNKSTVISLANRRGRVGCWTLERQCGLVPIHATTP